MAGSPELGDAFVYGLALNVDPEPDEPEGKPEPAALAELGERALAIAAADWKVLLNWTASEIEEAAELDDVIDIADLRNDLVLRPEIVFGDALMLSAGAPKQFHDVLCSCSSTPTWRSRPSRSSPTGRRRARRDDRVLERGRAGVAARDANRGVNLNARA